jgi:hypothetical protein
MKKRNSRFQAFDREDLCLPKEDAGAFAGLPLLT